MVVPSHYNMTTSWPTAATHGHAPYHLHRLGTGSQHH